MNKLIIAVALSMIAGQVFATGKDHHGNHGNNNGPKNGGSTANSTSASGAFSAAGAVAGAASISGATGGTSNASGGQGGTAVASVGAMSFNFTSPTGSTGSNGTSTSFAQHDYSGMPQQAPAMGNSYISTSNTCDGASGLGVVFPGGGVNFSSTALRMMCEGRLNSQAHKALGDEDKARKVMRVVDEYACTQDATWAKIAREEGLCKPDTAPSTTETNPVFNSK